MSDLYDTVIAHGPCDDGFAAAWAYWRTLPEETKAALERFGGRFARTWSGERPAYQTSKATLDTKVARCAEMRAATGVGFLFVQPQTPIPAELVDGRRVLVLDLDLGAELAPLVHAAAEVLLIDHHASSGAGFEALSAADLFKFTLVYETARTHSGASLAWACFNEGPSPPLVTCLQVNDTWNFGQTPGVDQRCIKVALDVGQYLGTFGGLEEAHRRWTPAWQAELEAAGRAAVAFRDHAVARKARSAAVVYVVAEAEEGHRCYRGLAVNASQFGSELGAALRSEVAPAYEAAGTPIHFCAVWSVKAEGLVTVSLRGPAPGIDLSVLARTIVGPGKQKGGGHPQAAGFSIDSVANVHAVLLAAPPDPATKAARLAEIRSELHGLMNAVTVDLGNGPVYWPSDIFRVKQLVEAEEKLLATPAADVHE